MLLENVDLLDVIFENCDLSNKNFDEQLMLLSLYIKNLQGSIIP